MLFILTYTALCKIYKPSDKKYWSTRWACFEYLNYENLGLKMLGVSWLGKKNGNGKRPFCFGGWYWFNREALKKMGLPKNKRFKKMLRSEICYLGCLKLVGNLFVIQLIKNDHLIVIVIKTMAYLWLLLTSNITTTLWR